MRRGLIPDRARVLDLGCGQGILLSLLLAAPEQYQAGAWPAGWLPPPADLSLRGIERRALDIRRSRLALGERVEIEQFDLREAPLTASDVIVLLDVLQYLEAGAQERLLASVAQTLAPGGLLIARVSDADAGLSSVVTRAVDYAVSVARGTLAPRVHCRSAREWIALLERLALSVSAEPMNRGTPFANVLLVARPTRRAR